ncbi:MAG: YggT family protein [Aquificae bacterium]|nr:YggT family protein [Aquificota bacterium]
MPAKLLSLLLELLSVLLFIYALGSWFPSFRRSKFYALLEQLFEPLLEPIRRVVRPVNGVDFSPLVLLIILVLVKRALG